VILEACCIKYLGAQASPMPLIADILYHYSVVLMCCILLPSYALYTFIPYCPLPAVGSAEHSGLSGPLLNYTVPCRKVLKMLVYRHVVMPPPPISTQLTVHIPTYMYRRMYVR
jgi:hypothetical protein